MATNIDRSVPSQLWCDAIDTAPPAPTPDTVHSYFIYGGHDLCLCMYRAVILPGQTKEYVSSDVYCYYQ